MAKFPQELMAEVYGTHCDSVYDMHNNYLANFKLYFYHRATRAEAAYTYIAHTYTLSSKEAHMGFRCGENLQSKVSAGVGKPG